MRATSGIFLLFFGFCCLFGVFAKGHVDNGDALQSLYAARSLVLRGDLGLPPEPDAHSLEPERIVPTVGNGMVGANGSYYVWFPVGHQLLLAAPAAIGLKAQNAFPEIEARQSRRLFGGMFWIQFFASWLPILCAGGAAVVLYLWGREFGATVRESLGIAAVTAACTQFWPMMVENLSDGPGLCFLLAAALQAVRFVRGGPTGGYGTLVWCGVWCGLAVLVRYPHGLSVLILGAGIAWSLLARIRAGAPPRTAALAVAALAAGGVPWLLVLLGANALRFGDPLETGYGAAALGQWFNYPVYAGLLSILFAFGKGLVWLSPLIVPGLWWARGRTAETLMVWGLFIAPVLLFANTVGWQSGPVWGVRYVAPGAILLAAHGLAVRKPWRGSTGGRWVFGIAAAAGLYATICGHLAPARGYFGLAHRAAEAHYAEVYRERGQRLTPDATELHYFVEWRFSPLHGAWGYAAQNADGSMARDGADLDALFGVTVPGTVRPLHVDMGFRHWWWVWLGQAVGRSLWPIALLMVAVAAGCLWLGQRLLRSAQDSDGMGR